MYKCVFGITYKKDEPRDAMWEYWRSVHGALVLRIPGLVKYVLSPTVADLGGSRFDGLAELYFEDETAFDAAMASVYWKETVIPDGDNFLEGAQTFGAVVEEHRLR